MDVINSLEGKWKTQFRKGFLELCVLTLVKRAKKTYGFEMLDSLKAQALDIGEGTLYPLLARLSSEGKLDAEWETPNAGGAAHPRKFYSLSAMGAKILDAMAADFEGNYRVYEDLKGGRP